jgi:hypothetical protein
MLRVGDIEVFFWCPSFQERCCALLPLGAACSRLPHTKLDDPNAFPVATKLSLNIALENEDGNFMAALGHASGESCRRLRTPASAGGKDVRGDEDFHGVTDTSLSIMLSGI